MTELSPEAVTQAVFERRGYLVVASRTVRKPGDVIPNIWGYDPKNGNEDSINSMVVVSAITNAHDHEEQERFMVDLQGHPPSQCCGAPPDHYFYRVIAE